MLIRLWMSIAFIEAIQTSHEFGKHPGGTYFIIAFLIHGSILFLVGFFAGETNLGYSFSKFTYYDFDDENPFTVKFLHFIPYFIFFILETP